MPQPSSAPSVPTGPRKPPSDGRFHVVAPFEPTGDQPEAIAALSRGIDEGKEAVCLLGATGTGKTFTMANVIERVQKPTLIISHNKTLAAQLYEELREFFPGSSVNYFVSYYDYYQPEAYIPQRDIYIEKDASRNDDLDLLRLAATSNLLSRRDVIVVASVSCIFGLGSPEAYSQKVLAITRGSRIDRRKFLLSLNDMQYQRHEMEFQRGRYRVRGDVVEIWPAYERFAVRVDLFGDEIERIELINPTSGEVLADEKQFFLFPAVHYVMPEDTMQAALAAIRAELDARVMELRSEGKLLEAQRLLARTKYDLEMMEEVGYCGGIENYSRFFDGREPGERPFTLLDYFRYSDEATKRRSDGGDDARDSETKRRRDEVGGPGGGQPSDVETTSSLRLSVSPCLPSDWLCIIDESHVTIPQIRAMFNGDRQRKQVLVEHGFRLPSAMDNRPLRFEEFESIVPQIMFVSATPSAYELAKTEGEVAEQVIRPTGLLDPVIEIKPAQGQVVDMIERCRERVEKGERVLVTALTKRLCEDLATYLDEQGLNVRYLHSEIDTLERVEILTDLRKGNFDVLVGVNLLREGLDLPEVSLVCILDADKEGFLRSGTSLIQQMGRAARNVNALVVMYADHITPAMREAIEETERRRAKQLAYNEEHGITPKTIVKAIREGLEVELRARRTAREALRVSEEDYDVEELVGILEEEMLTAAQELQFEKAAALRDQMQALRSGKLAVGGGAAGAGGGGRVRRSEIEEAAAEVGGAGGAGKGGRRRGGAGGGRGGSGGSKPGMPGVRANKRRKKRQG